MPINLRFTSQDWERIQCDWRVWWHHELDRPMTVINAYEWQGVNFIPQFSGWDEESDIFPVDEVLDYHQQNLEWAPGDGQPPTGEWLPLLKRIRNAGKLCQIYPSPEGVLTVTRELGGKGFMFWLTDPLDGTAVQNFLKSLELENKR